VCVCVCVCSYKWTISWFHHCANIIDSRLYLHRLYFILSSMSCPLMTSVLAKAQSQRCWWSSKNRTIISLTQAASLRSTFSVYVFFENCLLTAKTHYCYVATYHPLRYTFIAMKVLVSLLINILGGLLHNPLLLWLSCKTQEIPHFCECVQVLNLTCSDSLIDNILIYVASGIFAGSAFCSFSYSYTVSSVLTVNPK
jgi:olfactory receptor